ncbi:MAG: DNA repair protein RecN [Alphaproteobacteria bacterium]|nr:DNA repair protein RecN [Alphaproteobacteria bacterium]
MTGIQVLRILDLAVVEELEVELGPGLNVLTGETGAGKSILVKSLELVLGARAAPELVRTGATQAVVETLFELPDGTEHVVRRTVGTSGRSRAYVDGSLVTIQQLRDQVRGWVDISSQHEHHTLVDARSHLGWLDRFARHDGLLEALGGAYAAAREAAEALERFRAQIRDRAERLDLLRFQLAEIERVGPKPGELDGIHEELRRLEHVETLRGATQSAAGHVHGDRTAVDWLVRAEESVRQAARLDPSLVELQKRLESARLELEDAAQELAGYAARLDADPDRLAELVERERALSRLARRHGTIEAAIAHGEAVSDAIAKLEDAEHHESDLANAAARALKAAADTARALSQGRKTQAAALGRAVSEQLTALGMGNARIEVQLDAVREGGGLTVDGARLGPTGIDHAEFLIAPNPGEAPRPLVKVASGGELSRALLALKQVLSGLGPVGTYVFDEVDTGVGGAVAEAIGRKLHEVARHHQVLCITHQAVIAAWADRHLKVSKAVSDGRTRTRVEILDEAGRREELARMLGGEKITAGVRQAAAELLEHAR